MHTGRSILTEQLVGAWIKDAKEKASLPAMEKLVKVCWHSPHPSNATSEAGKSMRNLTLSVNAH